MYLNRCTNPSKCNLPGFLIYLLSTRVDLSFLVHKLAKFSANSGKVKFEGLVHLLMFIRNNTTLGLKYYDNINYATVTNLLRQDSINNENQFMDFLILVGKILQTLEEV